MKAYDALDLADRNNLTNKPLKEVYEKIRKTAEKGKYKCDYNCGERQLTLQCDLKKILEKEGYKVSTSTNRVDVDESDYYLHISWEE